MIDGDPVHMSKRMRAVYGNVKQLGPPKLQNFGFPVVVPFPKSGVTGGCDEGCFVAFLILMC
jgi:hypothetical protein